MEFDYNQLEAVKSAMFNRIRELELILSTVDTDVNTTYHMIELIHCDAVQLTKMAVRLRDLLRTRRSIKVELSELHRVLDNPLKTFDNERNRAKNTARLEQLTQQARVAFAQFTGKQVLP